MEDAAPLGNKCAHGCNWATDQQAVHRASSEVHVGSLQEAPISAFVVSDVCLHLVIHLLVCQKYPFDTCYLGKKVRDGEPCWVKMPAVLEKLLSPTFFFFNSAEGTDWPHGAMVAHLTPKRVSIWWELSYGPGKKFKIISTSDITSPDTQTLLLICFFSLYFAVNTLLFDELWTFLQQWE